jgi:hypothetical protein
LDRRRASASLQEEEDLSLKKLIDTVCPQGHIKRDVFTVLPVAMQCHVCGETVERLWAFAKAPGITPQGTQPEINTDGPARPKKVDTQAIALETMREVKDKWLRYSDDKIAEQHVSREINEKAGLADAAGNEKPLPKQDPITFAKPALSECAV